MNKTKIKKELEVLFENSKVYKKTKEDENKILIWNNTDETIYIPKKEEGYKNVGKILFVSKKLKNNIKIEKFKNTEEEIYYFLLEDEKVKEYKNQTLSFYLHNMNKTEYKKIESILEEVTNKIK